MSTMMPRYAANVSDITESPAGWLVSLHDAETRVSAAESNAYRWAAKDAIDIVSRMKGDKDGEDYEWLDKATVIAELRKLIRDTDN